jgi:hypothetical protein
VPLQHVHSVEKGANMKLFKLSGISVAALAFFSQTAMAANCVPGTWQSPPDMGIFDAHNGSFPVRAESEHFQIRWPANKPNHMTQAQTQAALQKLESLWAWFISPPINWIEPYCDSAQKIKAQVFTDDNYPFAGSGAGQRTQAMWVHKDALINGIGVLAHEFTHTMQYASEGMRGGVYPGWVWESHATFMSFNYPTNRTQIGEVGCASDHAWMPHIYYGSTRNRYCSWQFWEHVKNKYGFGAVNGVFSSTRNILNQDPLESLKNSMGWSDAQLNDEFGLYAMRNVNWDYVTPDGYNTGALFRKAFGSNTDTKGNIWQAGKQIRLARLDAIDAGRGRYVVNNYWAPQRLGYNLVRLVPNPGAASINVSFRGVVQDQRVPGAQLGDVKFEPGYKGPQGDPGWAQAQVPNPDSDWRWGVVAIDAAGNARPSPLQSGARADLSFALRPGDREVYMVVVATPSKYQKIFWDQKYNSLYRYPWKVQLSGAWPDGHQPGYNPGFPAGRRHANGGGWVADGAQVDASAYVGPNAAVLGGEVRGNARVEDHAIIWNGRVLENAIVGGLTQFNRNLTATNNAEIRVVRAGAATFDEGTVFGGTVKVFGDAETWLPGKTVTRGVFSGYLTPELAERADWGVNRMTMPIEVTAPVPAGWPDADPPPPAGQKAPRFGGFVFGNKAFNYSAGWTLFEGWQPNAGGDIHGTPDAVATAEFSLTGNRVAVYGGLADDAGIMEVFLDNVRVGTINQYRPGARAYNQLLWDSGNIANGPHVIKLVSTGTKSPESKNTWVHIDEVEVTVQAGGGMVTPPPTPAPLPVAAKPTVSIAPRTYFFSPGNVTITSTTPGARIRYTLDGSAPTAQSPVLTSAVSLCSSKRIKAVAEAGGYRLSDVLEANYTIRFSWFCR